MSIGILTKQKKFIEAQLKKGNENYEEIYQMALDRQIKKEIKNREEYVRIQDVTRKVMINAADEFIEHMKKEKL